MGYRIECARRGGAGIAAGLGLLLAGCGGGEPDAREDRRPISVAEAAASEESAPAEGQLPGAVELPGVLVYKSPTCLCCADWVEHLRENGFPVEVVDDPIRMAEMKARLGTYPLYSSCHTAVVDDYVVEGHVPADAIRRLLAERPQGVTGLAVPGMPMGSPGMEGPRKDPYDILALLEGGGAEVFESRR